MQFVGNNYTNLEMKSKSYVFIGMSCLILFLTYVIYKRLNQDISSPSSSIKIVPSNNVQIPTTKESKPIIEKDISSCEVERNQITQTLKEIKLRVKNVRKAYNVLKNDELEWAKYIRNWNIEAKALREENNDNNFACVHSMYFRESLIDLLQIGLFYSFDNFSKVNEFEGKLNMDINSAVKEIKTFNNQK